MGLSIKSCLFHVMQIPDVKLPSFSFEAPKVDTSKFSAPKFDVPAAPKFDASKLDAPKVSVPKIGLSDDELAKLPPQEVRDEKAAKEATKYKDLKAKAKDLEAKAKAAKDEARAAKKIAKEAKDDACVTRFGGKVLCIRPLDSGY